MEEPPQDCLVMADMQTPPTEDSGQIRGYQVLLGYPDYPLYKRLSDSTASWMVTG